MTKSNPRKVLVFAECSLYLRVIDAFDAENFGHRDWRENVRSICYGLLAASVVFVTPVAITLYLWFVVESDADEKKLVATVPSMLGLAELFTTFLAMMTNRRIMSETIDRIQRVIDQRE